MAKGRAVEIVLDEAEKQALTSLIRKHGAPQSLAARARIVLAAAEGLTNKDIAGKLGICAHTAGEWRKRSAGSRLDGLYDEPRPGAPRQIATTRSPKRSAKRWRRVRRARRTGA